MQTPGANAMSNQCTFWLRGQGRFRDLVVTRVDPRTNCPRCDANIHDMGSCPACHGSGRKTNESVIPYEEWSGPLWALLAGELNKQAEGALGK